MQAQDLPTPALLLDLDALEHNRATMAARWPGTTLRPHAKCFKSSVFAGWLADAGHTAFCCATTREMEGLADAVLNPGRATRVHLVEGAMARARAAHEQVGGEVVSGGGTGSWDLNDTVTELQAGSYLVMDTAYTALGLPFREALSVEATVISTSPGAAVADAGIKALAQDHGLPSVPGAEVLYCSDEHIAFIPSEGWSPRVGERIRGHPAHCDPTVALHQRYHLVRDDQVLDEWPIDLRHW